jgi:hypothetical protein
MSDLRSRHLAFLGLFLVVVLSMLLPFRFDVAVTPDTQKIYDFIDSLEPGSVMIVSFDHEASSLPEIRPLALATLRHAFSRGIKLIGIALLAEGTGVGYSLMNQVAHEYHRVYGEDYVFLGFKPQYIAAILSMGESIQHTFPEDYLGNKFSDLPMLAQIKNYDDIAAVLSIADGSFTTHWIEYGRGRYGITVIAAVTAAMVTTYDPYLQSEQLKALVGGLRGAAEYERLIARGGGGQRGMLAQTASHLYVILLIIIGNIIYFRSRKKKGRS